MYSRLEEIKNIRDIDILFLGASHAYRGFDVRKYQDEGYSCFNLGSSSQTPIQTEILLKRYFDQLNPKLIVYDVYPSIFASDGVESTNDLISNGDFNKEIVNLALSQKSIKIVNSLTYALFDKFILKENYIEPRVKGEDTYIDGGFVLKKLKYNNKRKYLKEYDYKFKSYQLEAFSNILNFIEQQRTEALLVQIPSTSYRYKAYADNEMFDSMMNSSNSEYLNYNLTLTLDDSLNFYDDSHLNILGSEIFNEKLLVDIKERLK